MYQEARFDDERMHDGMGWKQVWEICEKLEMMIIRFNELVCTYHFSILGWVE